jgi:hypothetical protein
MPARAILVVVIVRDSALRSALAAHLALLGVQVLTAAGPGEAWRRLGDSAILVIDEADMAGDRGEWIDALWDESCWQRIAVLTIDAPVSAEDRDWLLYVDKDSPADAIARIIGDWAEIDRQGA